MVLQVSLMSSNSTKTLGKSTGTYRGLIRNEVNMKNLRNLLKKKFN